MYIEIATAHYVFHTEPPHHEMQGYLGN